MYMKFASLSLAAAIICGKARASEFPSRRPACDQDDFLVARYGRQICPSEIDRQFTKSEYFVINTGGLQNFLQPDFSVPVVDTFSTRGEVALTQEQVESVCLTKCRNNRKCRAVSVSSRKSERLTGKMEYYCTMANPSLGRGAYLLDLTSLKEAYQGFDRYFVTFQRKSGARLPSFEEVQCDIDPTQLETAVGCHLQGLSADVCPLLTDDFNMYFAPALDCLNKKGGLPAVIDCVACLQTPIGINKTVTLDYLQQICPTGALNDPTVIRDTDICGSVCLPDDCESKIATAMLCVTGSPPITNGEIDPFGGPAITGGNINGGPANFTCPSVNQNLGKIHDDSGLSVV